MAWTVKMLSQKSLFELDENWNQPFLVSLTLGDRISAILRPLFYGPIWPSWRCRIQMKLREQLATNLSYTMQEKNFDSIYRGSFFWRKKFMKFFKDIPTPANS